MKKYIIILIGLAIFGGFLYQNKPKSFGAFSDPFKSIQLATNPTNGECLTTNGTTNDWTTCASGGGGSFPFSADTNYSQVVYSTSTPTLWLKSGLLASSTSYFDTINTIGTATSTIGNLGGVLNALVFSGSDITGKINTAYAFAPSIGTAITIPTATSSDRWYTTTATVATTDNKMLRVGCAFGGGASNSAINGNILWFTPTSGNAFWFDTNDYVTAGGSGIENCNIQGTNGTTARSTIGVLFGGTNGAFNGELNHVNINGMGKGVQYGSNTSFTMLTDSVIHFNGRNIDHPDTAGANCENMRILNSVIADSNNAAGGVSDLKGFYMQESGNCQWNIGFTSFDDNQMFFDTFGGTANVISHIANHHENPNGHTYSMVESISTASNLVNSFIGGDMMNDVVGGQPDQIKVAGTVNLIGFTSNANSPVTTPTNRIVNALASTTEINWVGLSCKGAQATTKVYGSVPCSPFGIGSDRGQPSLYVASSTSAGIGIVGIATSTTNMDFAGIPPILNIGLNPGSTASSTINMKKIQFQGGDDTGAQYCVYLHAGAWVTQTGNCNN